MDRAYERAVIEENDLVFKDVKRIRLKGKFQGKPGQFYMLRSWDFDPLLSRPLSILDIGRDYIDFLYLVKGRGTRILSGLGEGDQISLLGPLGRGFEIREGKSALVGGGIGLAPLLLLAKSLPQKPDLYLGFRTGSYFVDPFREFVSDMRIAADDGSIGYKGFVTDLIDPSDYSQVYACGPTPMLKSLARKDTETDIFLSLENFMACGFGACRGCSVKTVSGVERVCQEGPVFNRKELVL